MARPNSIEFSVAVHVLTILAEHGPSTTLSSESLSEKARTNPSYIRSVLAPLRERGLVTSQGGRGGGWRIATAPEDIPLGSLWQIFHTDEIVLRHAPDPTCKSGRRVDARLRELEALAEESVVAIFQENTIADLIER